MTKTAGVFKRTFKDRHGVRRECATYTIRYYDGSGRRFEEPTYTTSKHAAEAVLAKRKGELFHGTFFPGQARVEHKTIGDLFALWTDEARHKASIDDDRTRLGWWRDRLGASRPLITVSAEDVTAGVKALDAAGAATATRNRYLAVLRAAVNLAGARRWAHQDPFAGVKLAPENNARDRLCSDTEYDTLRAAAVARGWTDLSVLIAIAAWSGMRLGEIVGFTWDRLDLEARVIRLTAAQVKERKRKPAPIPAEALPELRAMREAAGGDKATGRVFRWIMNTYSGHFGKLADACGCGDLIFHDFRHTALTRMRRAGIDIVTMKAISGHRTLAMLERYNTVDEADVVDAMKRTEEYAAYRRALAAPGP